MNITTAEDARKILKENKIKEEKARERAVSDHEAWLKKPMSERYTGKVEKEILRRALTALEEIIVPIIREEAEKNEYCQIYLFGDEIQKYRNSVGFRFYKYLDNRSEEENRAELEFLEPAPYRRTRCLAFWKDFTRRDKLKAIFTKFIMEELEYRGFHVSHKTYAQYPIYHFNWCILTMRWA